MTPQRNFANCPQIVASEDKHSIRLTLFRQVDVADPAVNFAQQATVVVDDGEDLVVRTDDNAVTAALKRAAARTIATLSELRSPAIREAVATAAIPAVAWNFGLAQGARSVVVFPEVMLTFLLQQDEAQKDSEASQENVQAFAAEFLRKLATFSSEIGLDQKESEEE